MKKYIAGIILVLALILSAAGLHSSQQAGNDIPETQDTAAVEEQPAQEQPVEEQEEETLSAEVQITEVKKHGNVVVAGSGAALNEKGFEYGDVVSLVIGENAFRMPICYNYSQVEQGETVLVIDPDDDDVTIAVNFGDFASSAGIDVSSGPQDAVLVMEQKGGYLARLSEGSLVRSQDREAYPGLDDAEFANFREMTAGGLAPHTLYRSSSPVDPGLNRSHEADKAAADAGIRLFVNMTDSEESIREYEGFDDTYYASQDRICLDMNYDFSSEEFRQKLARGLREMIAHEGPYLIHCKEGKDRTGFMAGVLACLCGADIEEVKTDYMLTFRNFYGVTETSTAWNEIAEKNVVSNLAAAFGTQDLYTADLEAEAEAYLEELGLSADEIASLKERLTGKQ